MNQTLAEILLFVSVATNAALLIFIAGVLRKVVNDAAVRTLLSLAGFQVILIGRFWVIAEAAEHAMDIASETASPDPIGKTEQGDGDEDVRPKSRNPFKGGHTPIVARFGLPGQNTVCKVSNGWFRL